MKDTAKPVKRTKTADTFSADEKAAMREYVAEKKRTRGKPTTADDEAEVLAKIAAMNPTDRKLAERVHAIVKATAPQLTAKTWYGMPAYALNGKTVCFFQNGAKFKTRYSTLGFSDTAKLDDGNMWPNSYALKSLTPADEKRIAELLKKALS
jgi:uncharacterized protein YdhG (YjbR/CyaY superfamily)